MLCLSTSSSSGSSSNIVSAETDVIPTRTTTTTTVRTLQVSGDSQISVKPDICYLHLSMQSTDKTSAHMAYTKNEDVSKKVLMTLLSKDIDSKDIQTSNLQLNPIYKYIQSIESNVMDGFSASQSMTVRIRNLNSIHSILDSIVTIGSVNIGNIQFTVENPKLYIEQIRKECYINAQAKAQQICEWNGMKLGKPLSIDESDSSGDYYASNHMSRNYRAKSADMMMMSSASVESSGSISQGEILLKHSVSIQYEMF